MAAAHPARETASLKISFDFNKYHSDVKSHQMSIYMYGTIAVCDTHWRRAQHIPSPLSLTLNAQKITTFLAAITTRGYEGPAIMIGAALSLQSRADQTCQLGDQHEEDQEQRQ